MTKDIKDIRDKIVHGLKISSKRLIENKKQRNLDLVISRNGQIMHINPQDIKID
jgi:hypothetical protein